MKPILTSRLSRSASVQTSGIIVGGHSRAINAIEAQVRCEVQQKYAEQWKTAGLLRRWLLQRTIKREIAQQVVNRTQHISADSMF